MCSCTKHNQTLQGDVVVCVSFHDNTTPPRKDGHVLGCSQTPTYWASSPTHFQPDIYDPTISTPHATSSRQEGEHRPESACTTQAHATQRKSEDRSKNHFLTTKDEQGDVKMSLLTVWPSNIQAISHPTWHHDITQKPTGAE